MDKGFDIERELKGKQKGGHLENWHEFTNYRDETIVWGDCYGDSRFEEGMNIHTSTVTNIYRDENILETRNTYYTLGKERKIDNRSMAEKRAEANKQAKEYLDKNIINS